MTDEQLADHLERIDRVGYTILEGVVPRDVVAEMAAAFEQLYQSNLDTIRSAPNRGPVRHYTFCLSNLHSINPLSTATPTCSPS